MAVDQLKSLFVTGSWDTRLKIWALGELSRKDHGSVFHYYVTCKRFSKGLYLCREQNQYALGMYTYFQYTDLGDLGNYYLGFVHKLISKMKETEVII